MRRSRGDFTSFASRLFHMDFGIAEEDEDEVAAADRDLDSKSQDGALDMSDRVSVTSSRKSSIANAAIGSSIGPSLAGLFPGIPDDVLLGPPNLKRSASLAALNVDTRSLDGAIRDSKGRRWSSRLPFMKPGSDDLDMDEDLKRFQFHHLRHPHLPHLHIPQFMISGPSSEGGYGRKFSFGLRRFSHTVRSAALIVMLLDGIITTAFIIILKKTTTRTLTRN